jgi:hypothetical protein
LQLQALGAAEQERPGNGPERIPFGEDHQRNGNEAAACGHSLGPGERQRHRNMRACNPAEQAG